jgi:hypothetical protein
MDRSLFTELTITEQENLSGGEEKMPKKMPEMKKKYECKFDKKEYKYEWKFDKKEKEYKKKP